MTQKKKDRDSVVSQEHYAKAPSIFARSVVLNDGSDDVEMLVGHFAGPSGDEKFATELRLYFTKEHFLGVADIFERLKSDLVRPESDEAED